MRPILLPRVFVWVAALIGFAVVAGFAAAFDTFPAYRWLDGRLQEIDALAFVGAVDWAENLADVPGFIVVWLAASAALLLRARAGEAFLLLISMSGRLLNSALKELIDRPRPPGYESATSSFPSGHGESAMVMYGLLFYFAALLIPSLPLRLLLQAVCLWVVLFTGLERVYVGAHWPSDVLGGFYFGGLILALLVAAHRAFVFRR